MPKLNNSTLHHTIIKKIIDNGFAPDVEELRSIFNVSESEVAKALHDLHEYHGVVLHPNQPKVWVIHPFSLAPTNFIVKSAKGTWWGNCAWCSLGVAALLKHDLTITTSFGAYGDPVTIHIEDGKILEKDLVIHFPIPMKKAWDNVVYTCSTMLIFKNESQVDEWTRRHHIARGDIQPIEKVWDFSKKWYGSHLDANWKKWTVEQAKSIFAEFGLTHPIWQLEESAERF